MVAKLSIPSSASLPARYIGPSSYLTGKPPIPSQINAAAQLFKQSPTLPFRTDPNKRKGSIFTSALFRHLPQTIVPEVLFLGISNAGKSTLLNILSGHPLKLNFPARTSKVPGYTKRLEGFGVGNVTVTYKREPGAEKSQMWIVSPPAKQQIGDYKVGPGGFVMVDAPGYGKASQEAWGEQVLKYIDQRKMLRLVVLLVAARAGLNSLDVDILQRLRERNVSHQIVVTKIDTIYDEKRDRLKDGFHERHTVAMDKLLTSIREDVDRFGLTPAKDIICVSATTGLIGVDALRVQLLEATDHILDKASYKRKMK